MIGKKKNETLPAISGQPSIDIDPQALITSAIEKNASVETMERLLAMRQKLHAEYAEKELRNSMSLFQAEIPIIEKKKIVMNKDGKSIRYKYAPMDDIIKTAQPFIAKHGLCYDIDTEITLDPEGVKVVVLVYHILGHSKKSSFWVPLDKEAYMTDQQKWAAVQTFAKRYAFCNAFGILTGDEDNDGNTPPVLPDPKIEKQKEKAKKYMEALPEYLKKGFRVIGYSSKAVFIFCEKFGWNHVRIKNEIDAIANAKGAKYD